MEQNDIEKDASKSALLVLFLVTMIDMIGFGIIIPFLTYLVIDLAQKDGIVEVGLWVGLLMTSYSAAQFLFSPFWGSLSDRIGRRPILMIGLIGNTVFYTMFGFANTLLMAFFARFMAGVFNGNIAVARAYIGDVSTPQQLASRMGLIGAAFGLGFTFGPFIGGEFSSPAERWDVFKNTIFETYPYLLPCVIASGLSAVAFILAWNYLEESKPKSELVPATKSWLGQFNEMGKNAWKMLRHPSVGAMIWVSMLFTYGFTIMHAVFILFTEMSTSEGGLSFSEAQNGRIFAFIGIIGIITQGFLIGPLTKRFGSRRLIPIATLMTGTGLALIPYTPHEYAWYVLLPIVMIMAFGSGIFQPSSSSFLTQLAKAEQFPLGQVMGASESMGAFARIFGPLTGGIIWVATVDGKAPFDYHTAFHACALILLLATIFTLRLPRTINDIEQE
ncbi:MAG: MFS transporter [Candidatus Poseidoniales archaeon]